MATPARRKPPSRRAAAAARRERTHGPRLPKPPRRPRGSSRTGRRVVVGLVLVALLVLPFAALAFADRSGEGRIPEGTRIGGVDVGGLRAAPALARLRAQIGIPARRAVRVSVDGDVTALSARRAGVSLNLGAAVRRAVARGRRGTFVTRGWRELTGAKLAASEDVRVRVDRAAVRRFVDGLAVGVEKPAQPATLAVSLRSVAVTEGHDGRRLAAPAALSDRLVRSLRDLRSARRVRAHTEVVKAPETGDSLLEANPTVVTVSRDEKLVRVFDRGSLVKTFAVAVGTPEYPTPTGSYTVQTMQRDPVWNVPDSAWAGDLAGQSIPGGDPANPLKERFIGFNGSVGFHGTADLASLGQAASHGCVRMNPTDVKDLFDRVGVGTTVYVG